MSYCIRTDLAVEALDGNKDGIPEGAELESSKCGEVALEHLRVKTKDAERKIGKAMGEYITLTIPCLADGFIPSQRELEFLSQALARLMPKDRGGILVAGVGNSAITPDSLGPLVCEKVLATRHIGSELARELGFRELNSVSVLKTAVLGQSGIDAKELIFSVARDIGARGVIVIDALCSRSPSRIGTTIQLSSSGISPGSGVGGGRPEISEKTLGIPVIAIGIPTVVDALTIALDLLEKENIYLKSSLLSLKGKSIKDGSLMVTPKSIDQIVKNGSELLGLMINSCLQPSLSKDDIVFLTN